MARPGSRLQIFSWLFLVQLLTTLGLAQAQDQSQSKMPDLNPLPGTGKLGTPADPKKFTFVVAGDNRPASTSCPQPPEPTMIFSAVKAMNPSAAFVLWTGDTISGKIKEEDSKKKAAKKLKAQYDDFNALAAKAGVPVFNAPGNHEMDNKSNVPTKEMKDFYLEFMKQSKTYGAFTYGNSRFIALDSENEPSKANAERPVTMAEGEAKPSAPGSITKKQLDLLAQDLEADQKTVDNVFIFMHHPAFPYGGKESNDGLDGASVKALQDLFHKYKKVAYVLSGHQHLYYYAGDGTKPGPTDKVVQPPSRKDSSEPPLYLVTGGGGAPLMNSKPGSFFHYLTFKVDGEKVTPELVTIGSCVSCGGKTPDPCDPCNRQTDNKCSSLK